MLNHVREKIAPFFFSFKKNFFFDRKSGRWKEKWCILSSKKEKNVKANTQISSEPLLNHVRVFWRKDLISTYVPKPFFKVQRGRRLAGLVKYETQTRNMWTCLFSFFRRLLSDLEHMRSSFF
jgi:hypothetical protein